MLLEDRKPLDEDAAHIAHRLDLEWGLDLPQAVELGFHVHDFEPRQRRPECRILADKHRPTYPDRAYPSRASRRVFDGLDDPVDRGARRRRGALDARCRGQRADPLGHVLRCDEDQRLGVVCFDEGVALSRPQFPSR
jgi:hypothetical protein